MNGEQTQPVGVRGYIFQKGDHVLIERGRPAVFLQYTTSGRGAMCLLQNGRYITVSAGAVMPDDRQGEDRP